MKTIVRVLGALTMLATAAPAALADEPYYPPTPYAYQAPAVDPGYAPAYPTEVAPVPGPIVAQPSYGYGYGYGLRHRFWEARRAELRRWRWEAFRRWMWRERMEHRGFYRY